MKKSLSILILLLNVMLVSATGWVNIRSSLPVDAGINLVSSDIGTSVIHFSVDGFSLNEVKTQRGTAYTVSVGNATPMLVKGAPDLPKLAASVIIPDLARMDIEVISSKFTDYPAIEIAPSKGNLYRNINPNTVSFEYGKEYATDRFFPGNNALLRDPFIIRDYRGQTVIANPFQYNPVTKVLRVYYDITVRVKMIGNNGSNPLVRKSANRRTDGEFQSIYNNQFLNTSNTDYAPVADYGKMLVISYGSFMTAMQPFVDWKNSMGIPTEMVDVATIGSSATEIKSYIANYYNSNGLTFVLLVGDAPQVPTNTTGSLGGPSDVAYGYIVGNDHYPDLFVGRFSAENVSHVQTMVQRTLEYEKNPVTTTDWFSKGIGIGSDQGPGDDNEYDYQHIRNIRTDLMAYTYSGVAELYDGSQGGEDQAGNPTPAMVSNFVNAGAGIINYTGHGSDNSWGTTGFSNSNVTSLTNQHMWPFIFSVACVNGNFSGGTCFAESWLRATNGGSPTGAVATLMSTINQSWDPPMDGEDEMDDILVETYPDNVKHTFGGITMNGCMHMNDQYGSGGDEMTDTWTIFGDPSLMVRTAMPDSIVVSHASGIFLGTSSFTVNANVEGALVALSIDNQLIGTGFIAGGTAAISFTPLTNIGTVKIVVTAFNHIPSIGNVSIIPNTGPYVVYSSSQISDPSGNNNGQLDYGETVRLTLALSNIGVLNADNVSVNISTTDPFITLTDSTELYAAIPAGDTTSVTEGFGFITSAIIPDNHVIHFNYQAAGTDTWTGAFSVVAHSGKLEFGSFTISDPLGNNNGKADPGETFDLIIQVNNTGSSSAFNVAGSLALNDPFLTLLSQPTLIFGDILAGGNATRSYSMKADSLCPAGQVANMGFNISANLGLSAITTFSLVVGQIPVIVIDLDGNFNSGPGMVTALNNNFVSADYSTTFPADISQYSAVFVALGTYPDNHQLSSAEGQMLADFLTAGGKLYMEGGDAWVYDPETAVRPMFKIDGVLDGSADLSTLSGISGTMTAGMSMAYAGDNSYIDHISPLDPAFTIFKNITPLYLSAVAYDGGTYKTIGSSFEFSGLTDAVAPSTKDEYMLQIINFFGLLNSPLTANFSADHASICEDESVNFIDFSSGGATSWMWVFQGGDPDTSYDQNPQVHYSLAGDYDVKLVAGNGTTTSSIIKPAFVHVLNCTGIGNERLNTPTFWPNPCNGLVYVDLSAFTGRISVSLSNTLNVQVFSVQNIEASSISKFDFSSFVNGIYFLSIEQNGKRITGKLIIRK
jgi:PKD repeat protein